MTRDRRGVAVAGANRGLVALVALLALLLTGGCGGEGGAGSATGSTAGFAAGAKLGLSSGAPPKSLLLVTLDTTRRDHLGCYGSAVARTPCLDALAAQGVVYDHAWCSAPITLSSHTSILTGVYPCAHGIRENGAFTVSAKARLLPEVLKEAGFKTGAFIGCYILDARWGLNQGFDLYDQPDASRVGQTWKVVERSAGEVTDAALRYIDTLQPADRFFIWVHYYDPHYPYKPPAGYQPPSGQEYDGEIAFCDAQLARVTQRLGERKLTDGLLVAVTADHGEGLHEHAEDTHGIFTYETTMRVPLVVAPAPAGVAPGSRVTTPVSNVDLAATLLERLGVGRALLPDARTPLLPPRDADGDDERAIYFESLTPFYAHRWYPLRGVVWKGWKLIETRCPELYSLADDPNEVSNVETNPERTAALRQRLEGLTQEHPSLHWEEVGVLSPEDAQAIQSLGYAHASPGGDPWDATLPDAKERLDDLDQFDQVVANTRDSSVLLGTDGSQAQATHPTLTATRRAQGIKLLEDAKAILAKLRVSYAGDPNLDTLLGPVLIGLEEWAAAATVLERVILANLSNAAAHYNLGHAYERGGHPKWGLREMEKVVHIDRRSLAGWRWLAEYTMATRDWPAAAWWLDEQAKCEGQSAADLAELQKRRLEVQKQLDFLNNHPRPPKPISDEELVPEGIRAVRRAMEGR